MIQHVIIMSKTIEVSISQTLSAIKEIEVPDNFDPKAASASELETYVNEQIILPSDYTDIYNENGDWILDEFCVVV